METAVGEDGGGEGWGWERKGREGRKGDYISWLLFFVLNLCTYLYFVMWLCVQSIKEFMGEAELKTFINFCLKYIADLDIPMKR